MNTPILVRTPGKVKRQLSGNLLTADLKLRSAEDNLNRLSGWASMKLDSVESDYLYQARKAVQAARAALEASK